MVSGNVLPDNPIEFIRHCVAYRKILWTYHVNMQMRKRLISRQMIVDSVQHYEIIEKYPKDKYLPSYLVYSKYQDKTFHVLFAVDIIEDNVRIITAYYPSPQEWEEDFKTRRRSP